MTPTASTIRAMQSQVRQTPTGWLAISAEGSPLRIAVVGATRDEADDQFARAAEAWARLRELPDPLGTAGESWR